MLGYKQLGGIPAEHIEAVLYEDDARNEFHRRIERLAPHFKGEPRAAFRYHHRRSKRPLMTVTTVKFGQAKCELSEFGYAMLRRWEGLAGEGHMVIWLDSFFDAISVDGAARNDDSVVRYVVAMLDRWCKLLNATILAPLHPSRSGDRDGNTGYAPAWENVPRRVIRIYHQTAAGKQGEPRRPTGKTWFDILKWNGGPQNDRFLFWYENGQLVSDDDIATVDGDTWQAAADILLRHTYGTARLMQHKPGMTEEEKWAFETADPVPTRLRLVNGTTWKFGDDPFTNDHVMIRQFRDRTGKRDATAGDFIAACHAAAGCYRLGYRSYEEEQAKRSTKRLPVGFHAVAIVPDDDGEEGKGAAEYRL
jgi:hypothetical protein